MWNQGSSGKDLVGAAYARYDPQDGDKDSRLCILALSNETVYFEPNALSNQWIKLYGAALPGNPSNNKPNGGIIQDVGALDLSQKNGWEGCFPNIAPNCYNNVEIHSNWGYTQSYGNTASTGKNINNKEVTFALCLQGKTCTDPAECETACETYDCTESQCVNPMTKGDSCCATSADCEQPDEPCKEAVCERDDALNYNICKTTTKEDGECLPAGTVENDECTTSADCFGEDIEESADCATAKCEEPTTGGGKKCTYTAENAEMPCGDSKSGTYSAYDVCDLGFRCSSTKCVVQYAMVETDCTDSTDSFWRTMVADAGLSEVCHTAKCKVNSTDVSTSGASAVERTTCQVGLFVLVLVFFIILLYEYILHTTKTYFDTNTCMHVVSSRTLVLIYSSLSRNLMIPNVDMVMVMWHVVIVMMRIAVLKACVRLLITHTSLVLFVKDCKDAVMRKINVRSATLIVQKISRNKQTSLAERYARIVLEM
mmetsp:Transcript_9988/g.14119  ORF Transcript_9988/g.14119 Transcript_9988/m.14119 type:complete len:484 (+) Transcript_9988:265-1716(+)